MDPVADLLEEHVQHDVDGGWLQLSDLRPPTSDF